VFSIKLKISGLLRFVIVVLAILAVVFYSFIEFEHPYIDPLSIILMLLFAIGMFVFSGRFSSKYPPAIIITLLLILFVQFRTLILVVIPDSLLHSGYVTPEMFNTTLGYMLFGSIACYLGLALGYGNAGGLDPRAIAEESHSNDFSLKFLSYVFVFSLGLTLLAYFEFGYAGSTGSGENLGFFQRYVARFIYPAGWLMMFLSAYALYVNKPAQARVFTFIFFLYFASFFLAGSRAGIYELIILILSYKIIFEGNFYFKLNGWGLFALISLIPISLILFNVATQLRMQWYGSDHSVAFIIKSALTSEFSFQELVPMISGISYRLSFIEPTMFPIFFQELGFYDISELVNIKTTLLSAINRVIPGKLLGDILFTEYAYGFMYEPEGVLAYAESGRVDYVGYEWSMFGISYQLFGFLGGGMFIFGFTAFIGGIIRAFNMWGGLYGWTGSIFFMTILSIWVRNLGIDNLIDRTVHGLIFLFVNFAIYWLVMELLKLNNSRYRGANS